ncbi:MAG: endonuclease [Cytophagales bacterium]
MKKRHTNFILLKRIILIVLLLLPFLYSQGQDSVYYQSAFNSSGDTLKLRLYNIIKAHTEYTYTSSGTDVWDILKETDRDPNDSNNVILIYSNRSVNAAQEYNSGAGWSREHVWAKSRGDFGTSKGAGTDVHHLRPCDVSVNSTRNNRNFDNCISCIDVIDNGFNTGSKTDANLYIFEPPANVKGDIARMIFYMALRYEGEGSEPDLELTNTLQSNTSKTPLHATLNTLLAWNREDTVDGFERNRNQVIYSYQGNKNPFIDYPELAEYLFGDSLGLVWKAEIVAGRLEIESNDFTIYPNPSQNGIFNVRSSRKADALKVYNELGMEIYSVLPNSRSANIDLSNTTAGIYILEMDFEGVIIRRKLIRSF